MTISPHPLAIWFEHYTEQQRRPWIDLFVMELSCSEFQAPHFLDAVIERLVDSINDLEADYHPFFETESTAYGEVDPEALVWILRRLESSCFDRLVQDVAPLQHFEQWKEMLTQAFERVIHRELDACLRSCAVQERFHGFGLFENNRTTNRSDLRHQFYRDQAYPWMTRG